MNHTDKEFLDTIANERIQLHYHEHRSEIQPDKDQFLALDKRFQTVLESLSEEDNATIQEYLDYLFFTSATAELMLYKAGVKDGLKLARLTQEFI